MAIKGLARRLNEAGKVKIGCKGEEITTDKGKKMRLPMRLDHFIITTTEKDASGDFVEDIELMANLKKDNAAVVNTDGNIVGIPVRLLYDDNDLNFPHRMACYSGGILTCESFDGEKSRKRLDDFQKEYTCPCPKFDPAYDKNDKCKLNAKLTVIIDAAGLFGQVHVFRTTSKYSIEGIIGGVDLIKNATRGKIAGLPLMLTINNKTISTPQGAHTTIQVVSICYRGTMEDLQRKCLEIARENAQFLIDMKSIEDDARKMGVTVVVHEDEDRDFQEEFYPNSVMDAEFETVHTDQDEGPGRVEQAKTDTLAAIQTVNDSIEIVNSRDIMTEEQREMAEKSQEKVKKEMIQLGLFHRVVKERNKDEASKIARRLDKEYLIKFLETMGNADDMPSDGSKKPDYLEASERIINSDDWVNIVNSYTSKNNISDDAPDPQKNEISNRSEIWKTNKFLIELAKIEKQPEIVSYMRRRFLDTVINGTLPPDELFDLAEKLLNKELELKKETEKKTETTKKTEPVPETTAKGQSEPDPFQWDDGGFIEKAQLNHIAKLKSELKITDPEKWAAMVGKYLDRTGNPLPLAAKMTAKQADHFLNSLDEIPF